MVEGLTGSNKTDAHSLSTIGYHLPHGADGTLLDSYSMTSDGHLSLKLNITTGYTYLSCITSGLYIVQLDLDVPYSSVSSAP